MRKIGEVAALFRTTPRTLLYYEEQGIVRPVKTSGGTRMYSEADVRRFGAAYELASLGIPIKTIREIVAVRQSGLSAAEAGEKLALLLDGLIGDLQNQIARLRSVTDDLVRTREIIDRISESARETGTGIERIADDDLSGYDGIDALALVRLSAYQDGV